MKKILILFLMGISVMLFASSPNVDLPGPQFNGQEIQTFTNEVINPVCPMQEVSYNLMGYGIQLGCLIGICEDQIIKLEFPEMQAKIECSFFAKDFYRPPASNNLKAACNINKQHSNYGYPFTANKSVFS